VTDAEHFIHKPSILAKHFRNDTVLGIHGVLIQLFENPEGIYSAMRIVFNN